jgi:BlaI family penicillinase repressor
MTQRKVYRLGDLQLKIMKILWERGEANAGQVFHDVSKESDLAYTTISTMLRKMEARGLIAHRSEGRTFIYRPKVSAATVSRSMSDHLVEGMFEGSLAEAVNHLLTTREVSRDELTKLERLIAETKRRKSRQP